MFSQEFLLRAHNFFASLHPGAASKQVDEEKAQATGTAPASHVQTGSTWQHTFRKGRPTMQPSPPYASTMPPNSADGRTPTRTAEDRVYQGVSIAAMLLLLISLWLF